RKMLISSLIWILHLMNLTIGQDKIMRHKRNSSTAGRLCPTGCVTCSALNGCLSCKSRLFFHLEVDGMRQRGVCLSSCPRGHYGTRSPYINTCTKCPAGCELCMRRNMCARCRTDLYTLQGQCYLTCPKGFEPDEQLICLSHHHSVSSIVHCEVGEWSDWSPCVHKRSMKMYRRGEKTRTRQMLSPPSRFRKPCPKLFQFRKCIFKKRQSFISNEYNLVQKRTGRTLGQSRGSKIRAWLGLNWSCHRDLRQNKPTYLKPNVNHFYNSVYFNFEDKLDIQLE
uniref:R-spondin Fu-CRD domain-containing protein n=1 Tax=Periophthalmus magnuspinnatus TaxID=409849 RepID=A0A3B4A7L3_9GOBI